MEVESDKAVIASIRFSKQAQIVKTAVIEKEKNMALRDLAKNMFFQPLYPHHDRQDILRDDSGPYDIEIHIEDVRFCMKIKNHVGEILPEISFSMRPLQKVIKDYFLMVESYEQARDEGMLSRLEAIDMGRRGLHNEGAGMLECMLEKKVEVDLPTARRLFTLVCVLCAGRRSMW